MKLTGDEARLVVWGDTEDWEEVENNVVDNSRWSIHHEGVFKHLPTSEYYSFGWSVGATESQDESPFEYEDEVTPILVKQVQKTITAWEAVTKEIK